MARVVDARRPGATGALETAGWDSAIGPPMLHHRPRGSAKQIALFINAPRPAGPQPRDGLRRAHHAEPEASGPVSRRRMAKAVSIARDRLEISNGFVT